MEVVHERCAGLAVHKRVVVACVLTPDLVQEADFIFGMTHSHIDTVVMLYPQAAEKTFLLREFAYTEGVRFYGKPFLAGA